MHPHVDRAAEEPHQRRELHFFTTQCPSLQPSSHSCFCNRALGRASTRASAVRPTSTRAHSMRRHAVASSGRAQRTAPRLSASAVECTTPSTSKIPVRSFACRSGTRMAVAASASHPLCQILPRTLSSAVAQNTRGCITQGYDESVKAARQPRRSRIRRLLQRCARDTS